jgi:hypothetical protein
MSVSTIDNMQEKCKRKIKMIKETHITSNMPTSIHENMQGNAK